MPHRKDIFLPDHYYHVFNRGASKGQIFFNEDHYQYLHKLVHHYAIEKHVELVCYCFMPNHYHLLVYQQDEATVSEFMNIVFNAYVQAYNRQQQRTGTLFEGRFKHRCVDKQEYLLHLMRYIHLNPVKANLVQNPEEWKYSDYKVWIADDLQSSEEIEKLRIQRFRNALGIPDPLEYKKFVTTYHETQTADMQFQKYLFD